MRLCQYRFAVVLSREDGQVLRQVELAPDFEPLHEALRFSGLRSGALAGDENDVELSIQPVWDATRGEPFVHALHARLLRRGRFLGIETTVAARYFTAAVQGLARQWVREGIIASTRGGRYSIAALPGTAGGDGEAGDADGELVWCKPCIIPRALAPLIQAATFLGPPPVAGPGDHYPVFIPQCVCDELSEETRSAGAAEIASILIGHLCRNASTLFAQVTAQLPVRGSRASSTSFSFSPASWQGVAADLSRRGHGEQIVGWAHSHPAVHWCQADCSTEARRACDWQRPFFSVDDCVVQRTVFHQAFCVALLLTRTVDAVALNLFGWRGGLIEERGFFLLREQPVPFPVTTPAHIGDINYETSCGKPIPVPRSTP
jgi:hypothetical protein